MFVCCGRGWGFSFAFEGEKVKPDDVASLALPSQSKAALAWSSATLYGSIVSPVQRWCILPRKRFKTSMFYGCKALE